MIKLKIYFNLAMHMLHHLFVCKTGTSIKDGHIMLVYCATHHEIFYAHPETTAERNEEIIAERLKQPWRVR